MDHSVCSVDLRGTSNCVALASSCRSSVRLSVHCGSQGRCTELKVVPACSSGKFLFVRSDTFAGVCRLSFSHKKTHRKKRIEENANVSLLRHRLRWLIVACYVLLLTETVRGLWSVTLEWIEFGCVHKLYPEELNCVPAVCIGLNM